MLGSAVIDSFYIHLNEKGIPRRRLQRKVKLFCHVLDTTFALQSSMIQRSIAKRLFERLGLAFTPVDGKTLPDYIEDAKRMKLVEA
ncbi:MAG TPA: hypothetical protein VLV18_01895 [Terriglobales bacterium]|nr:hypothetical protein [Terriglobales bacterium]